MVRRVIDADRLQAWLRREILKINNRSGGGESQSDQILETTYEALYDAVDAAAVEQDYLVAAT